MKSTETLPRNLAEALSEAESLHGSLNSRLSTYRDFSRRLRPDVAKAYDDLIKRLGVLDAGEVGPKAGEPMPPFNLPNENGALVSLDSLLRQGPAVISFNRGHWCPYCKLELRTLAAANSRIRELGACVVSIMPDSARFTGDYVRKNGLPFSVLTDVDLGYALSLGLIFWVGAEIERLYRSVGLELDKYQGNGGIFLPTAAKFIVGQDGLIKARQVNIEFRERMDPDAIIAVLEEMRALRS